MFNKMNKSNHRGHLHHSSTQGHCLTVNVQRVLQCLLNYNLALLFDLQSVSV